MRAATTGRKTFALDESTNPNEQHRSLEAEAREEREETQESWICDSSNSTSSGRSRHRASRREERRGEERREAAPQ